MTKEKENIIRDNPDDLWKYDEIEGPDFGGYIVVASMRGSSGENMNLTIEGHIKLTDDERIDF